MRIWIAVAIAAGAAVLVVLGLRHYRPRWSIIQGAVIRDDSDPHKRQPIANAKIIATYRDSSVSTESDASGYFRVAIPGAVIPGQTVDLDFRHPDYKPFEEPVTIRFRSSLRRLVVVAMQPEVTQAETETSTTALPVSNVRIQYTVNLEKQMTVGTAANTFEVAGLSNIPCHNQTPCSPDGYWKAASGSLQMDAGAGNEFRDARASCIAGPCPFTRIDSSSFTHGGRIIRATAIDWSTTATFLLQAEVSHTSTGSEMRESYPIVFGRSFNFTVPPGAVGVTLLAELGGTPIVFPLSPDLELSWASCALRSGVNEKNSTAYQCELKPGYKF